jgi:hypothetical protein
MQIPGFPRFVKKCGLQCTHILLFAQKTQMDGEGFCNMKNKKFLTRANKIKRFGRLGSIGLDQELNDV